MAKGICSGKAVSRPLRRGHHQERKKKKKRRRKDGKVVEMRSKSDQTRCKAWRPVTDIKNGNKNASHSSGHPQTAMPRALSIVSDIGSPRSRVVV